MSKLIGPSLLVVLGLVLSLRVVHAQPQELPDAPQPQPQPQPQPPQIPQTPTPGEKAGGELTKGTGDRPWAAGVAPEKQKAALAKFREANELLNQGLFARASELYKVALESWKHPAIHYNLALALMNLDQPIEAYENLEKSIVYGEAPLEKDKFEHAKEYILLLQKQIASVEVSCDKPGAKVSVDGKEVFVAPGTYRARVRIGKHTFVAEKKGYSTRINAPFIGPSENFRIELKLYTAEELTRYNRRWQATWMPYAVLGAGIGAGLLGVVLELSANASYNDYDKLVDACNMSVGNNMGCPTSDELRSTKESGDTKKTVGYVAYGFAGAGIAAGVVLAILNRPKAYQIRPEDLQEEAQPRVSITPVITPTVAGAMVRGTF